MNNNDVLRRLRYAFDYNDQEMIEIYNKTNFEVSGTQVSQWLKPDDHSECKELRDEELAAFLNGFIILKRGKKEGPMPIPEKRLNNNIILRKIKIALNLRDDDMLHILKLADLKVSKHELSALFRKPTQRQYRPCLDQFLRNFLHGVELKYRK